MEGQSGEAGGSSTVQTSEIDSLASSQKRHSPAPGGPVLF